MMQRVKLQLGFLTAWLVGVGGLAGAAGYYPTIRLAPQTGMMCIAIAAGAALLANVLSVVIVVRALVRGARDAGISFLMASPVRLVLTLGLTAAGWAIARPSAAGVFIWAAVFYGLFLFGEVAWLGRVVKGLPVNVEAAPAK